MNKPARLVLRWGLLPPVSVQKRYWEAGLGAQARRWLREFWCVAAIPPGPPCAGSMLTLMISESSRSWVLSPTKTDGEAEAQRGDHSAGGRGAGI